MEDDVESFVDEGQSLRGPHEKIDVKFPFRGVAAALPQHAPGNIEAVILGAAGQNPQVAARSHGNLQNPASGRDFELVEIFAQAGLDAHALPAGIRPRREIIEPGHAVIQLLIAAVRSADLAFPEEDGNTVADYILSTGLRIDEHLARAAAAGGPVFQNKRAVRLRIADQGKIGRLHFGFLVSFTRAKAVNLPFSSPSISHCQESAFLS